MAGQRLCYPDGLLDKKGAIWRGLTPDGAKDYWNQPCNDTVCLAAEDLACAYHAMLSRDIPNSMGRGNTTSYDIDLPGYNAVIRGIGRKHPQRVAIYCKLLTKVASLDEETSDGEHGVSLPTIELAARLSALGHKSCIGQVIAALPHNEAMTSIIAEAHEECVLDKYPGCAGISRSSPP